MKLGFVLPIAVLSEKNPECEKDFEDAVHVCEQDCQTVLLDCIFECDEDPEIVGPECQRECYRAQVHVYLQL